VCLNAGNRAKTKALRLAAELCRAAKTFSKDYETIKTRPELTNRGFFQQAPRELGIPVIYYVRVAIHKDLSDWTQFADHLIAASDYIHAGLLRTTFPNDRMTRVYCGYDLMRFTRAKVNRTETRLSAGIPAAATVTAIVGQIAEPKGQDLLLRAAALLRERNVLCSVLIAGDVGRGQERYAAFLRTLISRLRIDDCVRFIGFEPAIERLYGLADLLVLCMPDEGGGGGVAVEAMSMGVPVVAPDTVSSRELITHGCNGFLYKPNCPVDLANVIAEARSASCRIDDVRANARTRAEEFRIEVQIKNVERVYDQVVAARTALNSNGGGYVA
jgi:glycosyltransferase involved in cell wall biosynthesis